MNGMKYWPNQWPANFFGGGYWRLGHVFPLLVAQRYSNKNRIGMSNLFGTSISNKCGARHETHKNRFGFEFQLDIYIFCIYIYICNLCCFYVNLEKDKCPAKDWHQTFSWFDEGGCNLIFQTPKWWVSFSGEDHLTSHERMAYINAEIFPWFSM